MGIDKKRKRNKFLKNNNNKNTGKEINQLTHAWKPSLVLKLVLHFIMGWMLRTEVITGGRMKHCKHWDWQWAPIKLLNDPEKMLKLEANSWNDLDYLTLKQGDLLRSDKTMIWCWPSFHRRPVSSYLWIHIRHCRPKTKCCKAIAWFFFPMCFLFLQVDKNRLDKS